MLPITQMLLTNHNRPKIKLKGIKGVVMHWTANTDKGADAVANRNYFNSTDRACSAHFIVDDNKIVQCIPDTELAYHVGASQYKSAGLNLKQGPYGPNFFTIGIEMSVNSDGDWGRTYINAVQLATYLLKKYKLTVKDMYRHYDITGKECPKMMIDEKEWTKFKSAVNALLNPAKATVQFKKGEVTATVLNCRAQPLIDAAINGKLQKGAQVTIYDTKGDWYLVNKVNPQWVCRDYVKII